MRVALKARLAEIAKSGSGFSLSQLMTQVAFDRLLARLFTGEDAESWILKGAGALIARLDVARHSKDIDLQWLQQVEQLRDAEIALRRAAVRDLGDHFTFTLGAATPLTGNTDGVRVPATASLGPTEYARFHVDLVAGQWVTAPPDVVPPLTPLGAGARPPELPGLSTAESHCRQDRRDHRGARAIGRRRDAEHPLQGSG
jgi:nucleotidyltransferase AbiEii toxin of type IV toxin-antitoxin system